MKSAAAVDTARLTIMLNELRLPTIKSLWPHSANRPTGKNGPPPASPPTSPSAIGTRSFPIPP
jgi:hypothetical protein